MTVSMYTNPDNRPLIVFVGNSLSSGYGLSWPDSYPEQVMDALGRDDYGHVNLGVSSRTTTEMQSQDAAAVDPLLRLPNPRKILVAWEITNDLVLNHATSANAYANWLAYITARRAAGWSEILTLTVIARSGGVLFDAGKDPVNQAIRNSGGACGVVVDVGAAEHLSTGGDELNTTYYQDQIHLTAAGAAIVAGMVAGAIQAL